MDLQDTNAKGSEEFAASFCQFLTNKTVKVISELWELAACYGFSCRCGPYILDALLDLPAFTQSHPYIIDFVGDHQGSCDSHLVFGQQTLWREIAALANNGQEFDLCKEWPVKLKPGEDDLYRSVFLKAQSCMRRAAEERARKEAKNGTEEGGP